jgi:hypothetical protein
MPKFCHNCGEELFDENAIFCSFCGTKVVKEEESKTGDDYQPDSKSPVGGIKKPNKYVWAGILLGIIPFIVAIFIFMNVYIFSYMKVGGVWVTIAQLNSYCSQSFYYNSFGPYCDRNFLFFYVGWLVSVILIIVGVYEIHYTLKKSS